MSRPYGSPAEPPVDLPTGVVHASPRAYNAYKCRCTRCLKWRRSYDQARYWLNKAREERARKRTS